jgi:hypothetical protein
MGDGSGIQVDYSAGDAVGVKNVYIGGQVPFAPLRAVSEAVDFAAHVRSLQGRMACKIKATLQPLSVVASDGSGAHLHFLPRLAPARCQGSMRGIVDAPAPPLPADQVATSSLDEILDRNPVVVLRGDPGAGKSTSCAIRVLADCRAYGSSPDAPVPVYVELGQFAMADRDTGITALARLVGQSVASSVIGTAFDAARIGEIGMRLIEPLAEDRLPPITFYFGGLNEITHSRTRQAAARALGDLGERVAASANRMVVTSRRYGFDHIGLAVFDIQPLSPEQVIAFIHERKRWPRQEVEALVTGTLGRQLTTNPLHLDLLCRVLPEQIAAAARQMPRNIAELYGRYINDMLRWKDAGDFEESDRRDALRIIAFTMQGSGLALTRGQMETALTKGNLSSAAQSDIGGLIEALSSSGFLVNHGGYSFADHQTLQEYLCAEFLRESWRGRPLLESDNGDPQRPFREAVASPQWWESAAFLGGMVEEGQLKNLLGSCPSRQLAAMMLRHATPGSDCERQYVARWLDDLKQGLASAVRVSERPFILLSATLISVLLLLLAVGILTSGFVGLLRSVLLALGLSPLGGVPVLPALAVLAVVHGTYLALSDALFWKCLVIHDRRADRTLSRMVSPILIDLCYLERPDIDEKRAEIVRAFVNTRPPGDFMRQRLERYGASDLPRTREDLERALSDATLGTIAASILAGLRDDGGVVDRVLAGHGAQGKTRQAAERLLLVSRLNLLPEAQRAGFLDELVRHIRAQAWPYEVRRALAAALRLEGYDVPWPSGWLKHVAGARIVRAVVQMPAWVLSGPLLLAMKLPSPRRWDIFRCGLALIVRLRMAPSANFVIKFADYLMDANSRGAEPLLRMALRNSPDNPILLRIVSRHQLSYGDADRALVLAQAAEDQEPGWRSTCRLSRCLRAVGRAEEADLRLSSLKDSDPDGAAEINVERAFVLASLRRYRELEEFTRKLPPDDVMDVRSRCNALLGNWAGASDCLGHDYASDYLKMRTLIRLGRWGAAKDLLGNVARRQGFDEDAAWGTLALAYGQGDFRDSAIVECTRMSAQGHWDICIMRAELALARDDPRGAMGFIAEAGARYGAAGLTPSLNTQADVDELRAESCLLQSDPGQARALLRPWLKDDWFGDATLLALCAGQEVAVSDHLWPLLSRWRPLHNLPVVIH